MKNIIIGIIIGGIIFGTIGVVASTTISSENVTYQDKTVNSSLNELYNEVVTGKELVASSITNKGITTTSSDSYATMAANINKITTSLNPVYASKGHTRDSGGSSMVSMTAKKDGYAFVFCSYAVTYENVGSLSATKNGKALSATFSSGGVGMHAFYVTPVVAGDVIVGTSIKVSGASQYAGGVTIVMI